MISSSDISAVMDVVFPTGCIEQTFQEIKPNISQQFKIAKALNKNDVTDLLDYSDRKLLGDFNLILKTKKEYVSIWREAQYSFCLCEKKEPHILHSLIGFNFKKNLAILIKQIQGAKTMALPYGWQPALIRSVINLGRKYDFSSVCMIQAEQCVYYFYPQGIHDPGKLKELQARMRTVYDKNAERLGFKPEGKEGWHTYHLK